MATKDWKLFKKNYRGTVWDNLKKKGSHGNTQYIQVSKYWTDRAYWQVLLGEEQWGDKVLKDKLKKSKAFAFARAYMRKH